MYKLITLAISTLSFSASCIYVFILCLGDITRYPHPEVVALKACLLLLLNYAMFSLLIEIFCFEDFKN